MKSLPQAAVVGNALCMHAGLAAQMCDMRREMRRAWVRRS